MYACTVGLVISHTPRPASLGICAVASPVGVHAQSRWAAYVALELLNSAGDIHRPSCSPSEWMYLTKSGTPSVPEIGNLAVSQFQSPELDPCHWSSSIRT